MPPGSARRLGRHGPAAALFALVGSGIAVGAWMGFPVFSDAIVPLLIHETGPGSVARRHADRPLYGRMLQAVVSALGVRRLAWIVIALAGWALFAWVTARLFRRAFPERAEWSWLPALLVLSPIVVQTQYVTLTIVYPAVLPVALVVAALAFGAPRPGWRSALPPILFAALASLISEYGVAAAIAGALLAVGLRERRTALWLAAGSACGAAVFELTADASARPDVTADAQLPRLAAAPLAALYRWLAGVWHATIGAYGGAVWHTELDPKSRGSAAIAVLGAVGAAAAILAARRSSSAVASTAGSIPLSARLGCLLLAVAAAVLPVAAAGRPTTFAADWTGEYETRFLLPALPFASVLLVGVLSTGMTRSAAGAAAALLSFLAVEASWRGARQAMLSERRAELLGRALLPLMRSSDGIVIAVGEDDPRLRWGSMLTGKMTAEWRDDDTRRVWAMARSAAVHLFGAREGCRTPATVDVSGETRWGGRIGSLSSVVWVTAAGDHVVLEPYCTSLRSP